jgi:hypothetical protein
MSSIKYYKINHAQGSSRYHTILFCKAIDDVIIKFTTNGYYKDIRSCNTLLRWTLDGTLVSHIREITKEKFYKEYYKKTIKL